MRCTLWSLLAAALLALCAVTPLAVAQTQDDLHPNAHGGLFQPAAPATTAAPAAAGDKAEKPAPTFAYFVAAGSTVLILCIICVPSRKSESMTAR